MAYIRTYPRADGSTAHQVCYRDPDNGGRQSSRTFDDPAEARLLKSFLDANSQSFRRAESAVVEMRSQAPTLTTVIAHHLDGLTGIEPGTVAKYRRMMETHVQPTLGRRRLDTLTRQDIVAWFNGIDRAAKTRRNLHAIVSSALDTAVTEQWIGRNPAKGIKAPPSNSAPREPVFLTRAEVGLIADTIGAGQGEEASAAASTFVQALAGTGLRYSEATALRAHIDARRDDTGRVILHVTRAWKNTDTGRALGGPKTRKSRRSIAASQGLSQTLTDHMTDLAPGALLFGRPDTGAMMRAGHFHDKYWTPCIDNLINSGQLVQRPRPHDLRHTHASWLIAAGASPKVIQDRMGHESVTTTFDVYGHLMTDADAAAADLLDRP